MQWRDGLLVGACLLLGPPVAALVSYVGFGVTRHGVASIQFFDLQFYLATLQFAYIVSWLPMLVAGIANAIVSRFASEPWRLAAALPAGAVPVVIQLGWLAEDEVSSRQMNDLFVLGLAGAVASLVCVALVEAFGPKLA